MGCQLFCFCVVKQKIQEEIILRNIQHILIIFFSRRRTSHVSFSSRDLKYWEIQIESLLQMKACGFLAFDIVLGEYHTSIYYERFLDDCIRHKCGRTHDNSFNNKIVIKLCMP